MNPGTMRREDLCEKFFCSVRGEVTEATRYIVFPMRCKSWDCPTCRKVKAEQYRQRMGRLDDGRPLYFLTLTYYHSQSPIEAWRTYNVAWNRLRTNISKQLGGFDYIRILESHNDSPYPHLHIIMDKHVSPSKLGRWAVDAGFGFQITMKKITTDGAFAYVRKYITKEWKNKEGWELRKKCRCRIISFSRGLLSPLPEGSAWDLLVRGSDFKTCLDHVRMDYEWNTAQKAKIDYERSEEAYYECTVVWTNRELSDDITIANAWEPDDWVPK